MRVATNALGKKLLKPKKRRSSKRRPMSVASAVRFVKQDFAAAAATGTAISVPFWAAGQAFRFQFNVRNAHRGKAHVTAVINCIIDTDAIGDFTKLLVRLHELQGVGS